MSTVSDAVLGEVHKKSDIKVTIVNIPVVVFATVEHWI